MSESGPSSLAPIRERAATLRGPTGAQVLCDRLAEAGVTKAFLVPGAQILPLVHELADRSEIRAFTAAHELGAAFMADGLARAAGSPGVCISIGGPGATNMLTAAVAARLDDSPVLFITSDVPREIGDRGAFQDAGELGTADVELFRSAVGWSRAVRDRGELREAIDEALRVLESGAPAHLVIPVDVQHARAVDRQVESRRQGASASGSDEGSLRVLVKALRESPRTLVLAGQRVCPPAAAASFKRFVEAHGLPVVTTLAAKGVLEETHRLSLGNVGFAGMARANAVWLSDAYDLLLVIGADFNERDSLAWHPNLRRGGRRVARLDRTRPAFESAVALDLEVVQPDLSGSLDQLAGRDTAKLSGSHDEWWCEPASLPGVAQVLPQLRAGAMAVSQILPTLRSALPDEGVLVVDGGTSRIYSAQLWETRRPGGFHGATSTAPTGWAVPAAIGIQLAEPSRPVAVLTGDASLLMHGIEMATAARYQIPMIVILLDNGGHATLLRRAETASLGKLVTTAQVSWTGFARSLGVDAVAVKTTVELGAAIRDGLARRRPYLIAVETDPMESFPAPEHVFLAYDECLGRPSGDDR